MATAAVLQSHRRLPPTRLPQIRRSGFVNSAVGDTRYSSPSNLPLTCSCMNQLVCVCVCMIIRAGMFMFVYEVEGMNPNEIFYGPVDLLIVPQVLSLLTPNLSETTCWAWVFSPSPLLLCVLLLSLVPFSSRCPPSCFMQLFQTQKDLRFSCSIYLS